MATDYEASLETNEETTPDLAFFLQNSRHSPTNRCLAISQKLTKLQLFLIFPLLLGRVRQTLYQFWKLVLAFMLILLICYELSSSYWVCLVGARTSHISRGRVSPQTGRFGN